MPMTVSPPGVLASRRLVAEPAVPGQGAAGGGLGAGLAVLGGRDGRNRRDEPPRDPWRLRSNGSCWR